MTSLPSIFGHSLWLAFWAGAAAVHAAKSAAAATAVSHPRHDRRPGVAQRLLRNVIRVQPCSL